MALYENVFIVRQDVSNQQVEELTTRFTEILESGDGKVEKWEVDVFERIKAADEDRSGSINVKE